MIYPTIINFLHLLATVMWVGGMLYIHLVLMPSLTAIDPPQRGKLLGVVSKRFSILAWGSVIILLITGYLLTPDAMLFDMSTTYGIILTLKHVLFLLMIVIGLLITFVFAPKMETLAPKPGEKPSLEFLKVQKQLSGIAFINMILGVLVLLSISIL